MTIKQQITLGLHFHNAIFHSISFHLCHTLCQFYSIASLVLFTRNNKLWNERKEGFFICMAASANHFISKYVENCIFRHNRIFRHTCMYK